MSTITLCWLVAYVAGAVGCAVAIAADFARHRDGFPIAEVVFRVVVAAVLWPLVALFAVVDAVARGRR